MHCIKLLGLIVLALLLGACSSTPKTVDISPELLSEASVAYQNGLTAMREGRDSEAMKALQAVADRYPMLAGPQVNLGLLHQRGGDMVAAQKAFDRALTAGPTSAAIYNQIALFYRDQGAFDRALQAYKGALSIDAGYAPAQRNIAILYDLYLQQPKKALSHFKRYLTLLPEEDRQVVLWIAELEQRLR